MTTISTITTEIGDMTTLTIPSRQRPTTFEDELETFLAEMPIFGNELNTISSDFNSVIVEINTSTSEIEDNTVINNTLSASLLQSVNATVWNDTTYYDPGDKVFDPGNKYRLYTNLHRTIGFSPYLDAGYSWRKTVEIDDIPIDMNNSLLSNPKFMSVSETLNSLGSLSGGTETIDLTLGNVVSATITTTQTFAFSTLSTNGISYSFTLFLTDGGSETIAWPSTVKWSLGITPTLTSSGLDILTFTTIDNGTTWHGFVSGYEML